MDTLAVSGGQTGLSNKLHDLLSFVYFLGPDQMTLVMKLPKGFSSDSMTSNNVPLCDCCAVRVDAPHTGHNMQSVGHRCHKTLRLSGYGVCTYSSAMLRIKTPQYSTDTVGYQYGMTLQQHQQRRERLCKSSTYLAI